MAGVEEKTVLVVEPNKALREVMVETLKRHGFTTLAAADLYEGLRKSEVAPLHLAVVPTSDSTGVAEIQSLRSVHPQVRILLTGKFPETTPVKRPRGCGYMQQPYGLPDLVQRLESMLLES